LGRCPPLVCLIFYAGGIRIGVGVTTNITNSSFVNNTANLNGGGFSTVANLNTFGRDVDLKTLVEIDATFSDNKAGHMGKDVFAGPFFYLEFTNKTKASRFSEGVAWRRRSCFSGEYLAALCEPCK
jgi:hypothetical protein